MLFSTFNIAKTLLYYKGGEFLAHGPWKHRRMYHKGDYELILCIKGPIYLQIGDRRVTLQHNEVIFVTPLTPKYGDLPSNDARCFYWL
ncbi:MAG: AraC family ligand binding domain-containing protein, partial [Lentilactobacillus hilgardii]